MILLESWKYFYDVYILDISVWIRPGNILSAVPHGSILGYFPLAIYINDLPDRLEIIFKMYTDDSKFIVKFAKLQEDIVKIKDWCE